MNALDFGILAILALCAWGGFYRGLIRTVYRLVSFFVALFLAYQLYPHVSSFLRGTELFPVISGGISRALNLETVIYEHAVGRGGEIIDSLPLPSAIANLLHANNTPDIYAFLQVATIDEYISGFFANMIINAIAILVVFALATIALAIVGAALDVVGMLPVISTLNHAGGLAVGVIMGALLVWIVLLLMTPLFATGAHHAVYDLLQESIIARWLFDNEFLLPRLAEFR